MPANTALGTPENCAPTATRRRPRRRAAATPQIALSRAGAVRPELYGWLLRLHRSMLAYYFAPLDAITTSDALPGGLRLAWLLLGRVGLLSLALVSSVLQPPPLWLLVQLLVRALLLCTLLLRADSLVPGCRLQCALRALRPHGWSCVWHACGCSLHLSHS